MRPFVHWHARARASAVCLVLPDGQTVLHGELDGLPAAAGLLPLRGDAKALALGLLSAAKGSATAFPLSPRLSPATEGQLLALARSEASPRLALIITTSGSTGIPKGVKLSWRAIAAAARLSNRAFSFGPGDCWLCPLPLYHIGGAMILYRALRAGAAAVIHEGFDVEAIRAEFARRPITHVSLVPTMLAKLLEAGIAPPASLRVALIGGAALARPLFLRARAAGWPIVPSYGMSETCAVACACRDADETWPEGDAGQPLAGVRVRLGSHSRIEISTPARYLGYLGEPSLQGAWITTNDLGEIDAKGRLRILGRLDEVINSGGMKIHPAEIENRLLACAGVSAAGVVGLPDPLWGQTIACAFVGWIEEAALERWCREWLPSSMRPRRFLRVGSLPMTATGKLDRRAMLALWQTTP
ncbi:MAG: AMP-binding protein [Rhodocyclaceae bacterium]|nr:AMP-binding protein [Rhodocyclaceae bacterium]